MFPSDLLSVQFFKTNRNTCYHIILGTFGRFKLICFDDSNKIINELYFSIQEREIITQHKQKNNKNVIHIDVTTVTDINKILRQFGNYQITYLELFPDTVKQFVNRFC